MNHPNEYPSHPRPAVAVLIQRKGRILAVLRGNPPARSTWALPGGSIELGEGLMEAAAREVMEETGVKVEPLRVITAVDAIYKGLKERGEIRFHYVIIYVEARYIEGVPAPGDDVTMAQWLTLDEMRERGAEPATLNLLASLLQ